MAKKILPSIDRLREVYSYDPKTGSFRKNASGAKGFTTCHCKGYLKGKLDNYSILAHRAAWALYYGEWPAEQIDHKNNDKQDNRIENLRICNNAQNHFNMPLTKANSTGYKGVSFCKKYGVFKASIMLNGKSIQLGKYGTAELAHEAYKSAAMRYHGDFCNFG